MKGFINDSGNFVSNIIKIFMYFKTKKDAETLETPAKTSYALKSYDSVADNIKDKRLTAFFKVFIVVFGLYCSSFLLHLNSETSKLIPFAQIGGYGWSAFFFFLAFIFLVADLICLWIELSRKSFSFLDKATKNSLMFYFIPTVSFLLIGLLIVIPKLI